MCNNYEQHVRWQQYCKMMQDLALGIPPNRPTWTCRKPTTSRSTIRPGDARVRQSRRARLDEFQLPAIRPGGPVFNFRSEGRHFDNSNRCIIPSSAFFEFVGKKYPKAKYRFALKGSPITAIAGLWREGQGNHPPSFTMLTTSPGEDIAPYHNRQVVILKPEDWAAWLHLSKPEAELLRPLPAGSLDVALARPGSE